MADLGVISLVSTALSAVGTVAGGVAAKNQADFQAEQQEMAGKEEFAASQREANEKRKEATYVQSRQQALAAASGGGAADPTIVRLMTQTAQQGEMNAQTARYVGENRQRGLMDAAKASRMSGEASLFGSFFGATGDAFSGWAKYRKDRLQTGGGTYGR
jgi:hypothetical protein